MVFCGRRTAEVLGLSVRDIDIDIDRGSWIRVMDKLLDKERRVPLDPDVASLIQTHLLDERPKSTADALFIGTKGPNRGQPLTAAGLRTTFRSYRAKADVLARHPHTLRHSFGIPRALCK